MNRLVRIAVVSLMLAPSVGTAQDFDVGLEAAQSGDFETALREWVPLAEQGNARAQYNLGVMYANGKGVPQDDAAAVKWYLLAAEQGVAPAWYNLGLMYDTGRGVPQDDARAVKWYRLAAKRGVARAQFNLGVMYAKGKGVPQDHVTAQMWFNLAGANGVPDANVGRDRVAALLAPAEVSEAQRRARACLASNYRDCD